MSASAVVTSIMSNLEVRSLVRWSWMSWIFLTVTNLVLLVPTSISHVIIVPMLSPPTIVLNSTLSLRTVCVCASMCASLRAVCIGNPVLIAKWPRIKAIRVDVILCKDAWGDIVCQRFITVVPWDRPMWLMAILLNPKLEFAIDCYTCWLIALWLIKLLLWASVAPVRTSFNASICSAIVLLLLAFGILKPCCNMSVCISGLRARKNVSARENIQLSTSSGSSTI